MLYRNRRKEKEKIMKYEAPIDADILQAYLHKNASRNRSEIRRIKRALRRSIPAKQL